MPRFILLEHTGAPDDPAGRHFDFLLESGDACRTWRLAAIPDSVGPAVQAEEIGRHRLEWLFHEDGPVSGGRGWARRFDAGTYDKAPNAGRGDAEEVTVVLAGSKVAGTLRIAAQITGASLAWFEDGSGLSREPTAAIPAADPPPI